MKYSNTTIKELSARYRAVLKKCAIFNAMVVVGVALLSAPAMAAGTHVSEYVIADKTITNEVVSDRVYEYADTEAREDNEQFGGYAFVNRGVKTTVKDSTFKNISFDGYGAVFGTRTPKYGLSAVLDISGTTFDSNHAELDGGAVANYNELTITGSTFTNNTAMLSKDENGEYTVAADEEGIGGGAIALGSVSSTKVASISDTTFEGNISGTNGGAIGTRLAVNSNGSKNDNSRGILDIEAEFTKNKAYQNGGAFYNTFYADNGLGKGDGVTVKANFTSNEAGENGGAIYNDVSADKDGNAGGVMTITDSTFTANKAGVNGGAIYSDGIITLKGKNVFAQNTAKGALNDIYNAGTVNVAGSLTLDGGIAGTGSVVFKDGASLTATLNTTKIEAASVEFEGNNKINLIVENGTADAEYDFIKATTLEGEEKVTFDSSLYNLSLTEAGKIALEAKSAGQIAQDTGVSEETAQTLAGIAAVDAPAAAAISEAAQEVLASGDVATVEAELGKLTPNDKNATQQAAIDVATQVAGTVSGRLSSLGASVGRSGGDVKAEYGMWAQGMYNKSKLDGAFRGYTQGLAFGVDTLINDVYTVGIGYAYTATDVKSDRKTKAFGDNFFVYGQYKPSNWYVNGMVSYAHTNYKEEASVFGNAVDAKYDVDTYAGQLAAGYETKIGITPEIGARYIYLKQDTYSNGISTIDADNYDVLTGIAAVKYAAPAMGKEVVVTPEARMAATYDFIADNGQSVVSMPGATAYVAEGERLARFGAEFGVSAKVEYKDLELSLGYDFGVRRDYTSQTGSIKLKYNF